MATLRREGSFQQCQQATPRHHNPEIRNVLESVISLLGEFQEAHNAWRRDKKQMWDCISPFLTPKEHFLNGNQMNFDDYFTIKVTRQNNRGEIKWKNIVEFNFQRQSIIHMTLFYNPPRTTQHEWQDGVHFTNDITGYRTFLQPNSIRDDDYESTYRLGDQIGDICMDLAKYFKDGVDTHGNPISSENLFNFLQLPPRVAGIPDTVIRGHIAEGLMIFAVALKAVVIFDRWKNDGGITKKIDVFEKTDALRLQINLPELSGEKKEEFMGDGFKGTDNWIGQDWRYRQGGSVQKKLIVYSRKIQKIKELTKILNKNKSKNKIKIQKNNKQIKELKEKIKNTKEKLKKEKLKKEKLKKEKLKKEKLKKEKLKKEKLKKEKLKKEKVKEKKLKKNQKVIKK